jgi:heme/copper-type cytochrome/quinol oxidase subunit 2
MNKERLKGEIFDATMWLIAFAIKVTVIGLIIYSLIRFVKWSWNC